MIIVNLHIFCFALIPFETNSPLFIYANAILTGTITTELLKSISGWRK